LPRDFNSLQLDYISQRLRNNIKFARKHKPSLFIFNGNAWYILLIRHGLIQNYEKVEVTDKFNIYFFEIKGIHSVLFNKFFQRHFWGLTNHHRAVIIPELIREKYDLRFN
jgi:hypothetical protein